jgi:hypothetical protein
MSFPPREKIIDAIPIFADAPISDPRTNSALRIPCSATPHWFGCASIVPTERLYQTPKLSPIGPSRHFRAKQQLGRYWGEADIAAGIMSYTA